MTTKPTEQDVGALAEVARASLGGALGGLGWAPLARDILASDWYAERIAEARREGAADELYAACDGLRGKDGITVQWLRDRAAALSSGAL